MTDIDIVQILPSLISENENSREALTFPGDGSLDNSSEPIEWTRSAPYFDLDEDDQEPVLQNGIPQDDIEKEGDTLETDKSTFHRIL